MKKSMIIGKRQMVLAVLVVALACAVYLNWKFAGTAQVAAGTSTAASDALGNARYVDASDLGSAISLPVSVSATNAAASPAGSATSASGTSSGESIVQVRTDRDKAHSDAEAVYQSIIDDPNADADAKSKATTDAMQLAQNIQTEGMIESLVKAKGFKDCVAVINNDQVNVIVESSGLLQSETMQIQDIATSQSKQPLANIKISTVNG